MEQKIKTMLSCSTPEQVKEIYRKLAFEYHPDRTGRDTTIEMQKINAAFEEALMRLDGKTMKSFRGKEYTYSYNTEDMEAFKDILHELFKLKSITIELCGSWLWLGGETKPYKEQLKELGCKWSPKKKLWSWHRGKWFRQSGTIPMDAIRKRYGSSIIRDEDEHDRRQIG